MAKDKLSEKIWEQSSEWIDQIGEVVKEMAKQLGVASEHVYTVYTKQVFYEGLTELISSLVLILLFLAIFFYSFSKIKKVWKTINDKDLHDDDVLNFSIIGLVILVVICFGVVLFQLDDMRNAAMKVFNPEYYTIKMIIDQISSIVNK